GGDDFDQKIIDWMVAEFRKENGIDLSQDKMATQRLKDAAEKAKKDLSGVSQTQISLPFITAGEAGPLHLELNLTRAHFDELTDELVDKTMTDRKSRRLNSSHVSNSYAVFCLKTKTHI